ncbi:MAG: hypothetical protein AAF432_02990 [Planctomycetota bacterium]
MVDHFEHNPNDHEDPDTSSTWLIGILSVVLFVITCLGLITVLYQARDAEFENKVVEADYLEIEQLRSEQSGRLEGPAYRLIEKDEGTVTNESIVIPVDDAIDIIASEY